ncbi:MAG TPA: hypothetical protein P5328_00665 [Candidatus Paceibacterota bacterium]|nr:hypothetical protein [Candidatus Paceibacterota bacterium]HRZ34167.1 hypothetical protein [Candidatus Paceibacterota bacterium]
MSRNKTALIAKAAAGIIVVMVVIGYAIFNSRLFIEGPRIIIESPQNGGVFDAPLIKITGKALNISYLELDGRQIYTEENYSFSESLLLHPGYNIIQLVAKDKFGRGTEESLQLMYLDQIYQ